MACTLYPFPTRVYDFCKIFGAETVPSPAFGKCPTHSAQQCHNLQNRGATGGSPRAETALLYYPGPTRSRAPHIAAAQPVALPLLQEVAADLSPLFVLCVCIHVRFSSSPSSRLCLESCGKVGLKESCILLCGCSCFLQRGAAQRMLCPAFNHPYHEADCPPSSLRNIPANGWRSPLARAASIHATKGLKKRGCYLEINSVSRAAIANRGHSELLCRFLGQVFTFPVRGKGNRRRDLQSMGGIPGKSKRDGCLTG